MKNIKIKVYQSKEDKYIEMEALARYEFIGETNALSFIKGRTYDCVGYENGYLRLIDESGEDYLYSLLNFKKID